MVNEKLKLLVLVMISILWLAGCGLGNKNMPTLVPPSGLNSNGDSEVASGLGQGMNESPRTGSGVELPPTWTPGAPESVPEQPQVASTIEPDTAEIMGDNAAAETNIYVVQPGDTLAELAERFNVTLEQLASTNGIADINHIESGQELLIPSP